MSRPDTFAAPPPSVLRRTLGLATAVLAVAVLVAFATGAWNPWRLVRLEQYFGNPFVGLVLLHVLVVLAFWLLAPVRSEAAQSGRHTARWVLVVLLIPVLMCAGFFHSNFGVETREVAHSPSGERRAALVSRGDERELRIWVGGSLTMRDAGVAGYPCGPDVVVRFVAEDAVQVKSVYGDFDVRLDPKTGRPLNPAPRRCA